MRYRQWLIGVLAGLLVVSTTGAQDAAEDTVRAALAETLPGLTPDNITESAMPGLYEVTFGTRIVYVSADGRFLVQGKIVDLTDRREITEERLSQLKRDAIGEVGEAGMVSFGPEDARHTVTVFTDIDCGYCRKMHGEMAQYNARGIRIRYLFYPRAGIGSDAYRKAVSVWCADDRHEAMNIAKAGGEVPEKTCDNPVADHYALGQAFGIQGTPAMVFETGEVLPGYVPAGKLAPALDQLAAGG
jgi:thiol:disulfide interchange protein DsbC